MGFTVETRPGPALAIRAGKNDRTPVFVDVAALTAKKGSERAKFLKEEADRGSLDRQGRQGARGGDGCGRRRRGAAADRRRARLARAARSRRRARRCCSRPTSAGAPAATTRRASLTEPIVRHALEPAFERLGPDATPEEVLDLKVCDPAMGSGAFLVEACRAARRAAGAGLGALAGDAADDPAGRGRAAARPPAGGAALPLRRRQEPARRRSRQAVAVARDARARPRVHLPRPRAEMRATASSG